MVEQKTAGPAPGSMGEDPSALPTPPVAHDSKPPLVSRRGAASTAFVPAFFHKVFQTSGNRWSPTNPDGYHLMASAESVLSFDLIMDKLSTCRTLPLDTCRYCDMRGASRFRMAMAHLLGRTLLKRPVDPQDIIISAGGSAVLDLFFWTVCDPGDAALIPTPYYPAFNNDLGARPGVTVVPVHTSDRVAYIPTVADLEEAWHAAQARGLRCRVLLLTNPANPLGTIYPRQTLKEMVVWAIQHSLHLLCDEIYANSMFQGSDCGEEFVSALTVAEEAVAEGALEGAAVEAGVHLVYGMSKDFGLNGFRVGCLVSKSKEVHQVWRNLGIFCAVSNDTQEALSVMLEDEAFVDFYLAENKRRLKASYDILATKLAATGVPFVRPCAAMFVWVDFRQLLEEPTFEEERRMWEELVDVSHVVTVPGEACFNKEPGFLRVGYTSAGLEDTTEAASRLAQFYESKTSKAASR